MPGIREQGSGLGQRVPAKPVARHVFTEDYDLEEDEQYYITRPHTSVRRYDLQPEQVIRQGNKTYHVHQGSPPARRRQSLEKEPEEGRPRRVHWLVYLGIFFMAVIAFSFALISVGNWWQQKQDDWTYGQTRTYQTDAVVGHNDSSTNPTHFIAENLNGQIIVLEISRSDPTKARRYNITTVQGNEGNPPVKLSFQDINGDGKVDMIISIGDPGSSFTIMLFNDGTQFVSRLSK